MRRSDDGDRRSNCDPNVLGDNLRRVDDGGIVIAFILANEATVGTAALLMEVEMIMMI